MIKVMMIKSQVDYCPLVRMFCSRQSNNVINKIHERSLKFILETKNTVIRICWKFSIHQGNLRALTTEIYKTVFFSTMYLEIMNIMLEIFRYSPPTSEKLFIMDLKQLLIGHQSFGQK